MPNLAVKPSADEAPAYYFQYIDLVEPGDIREVLERQGRSLGALLRSLPEGSAELRYAPEKWSLAEVVGHISDTERVFALRAMWFARGFEAPLPGFDQDAAVISSQAQARELSSLIEELEAVRRASTTLFRGLPEGAWSRRGVANGREFSVKAVAFMLVGHAEHHVRILNERYL